MSGNKGNCREASPSILFEVKWAILNRIEEQDLDGRNSAEVFFHGHGEERGKIGIFLRFQVRTNKYLSDVEADLRMADPELQTIGIFAPKTIDGFASRHRDFGKTRFWEMQKTYMQQWFHRS